MISIIDIAIVHIIDIAIVLISFFFIYLVKAQPQPQLPAERPFTISFGEKYWEPIDDRFEQCYVHCPPRQKEAVFKCWKVPSGIGNLCHPAGLI